MNWYVDTDTMTNWCHGRTIHLMEVLPRLREVANQVLADEPVLFAYLFGSHARGQADSDSDVDVAVYLGDSVAPEGDLDISLRLAGDLARGAGVRGLDALVVLNRASLPVAGRVVGEGQVIYSRAEPERVRYESRIFREFTDFNLALGRPLDEELIRSHAEGRR